MRGALTSRAGLGLVRFLWYVLDVRAARWTLPRSQVQTQSPMTLLSQTER